MNKTICLIGFIVSVAHPAFAGSYEEQSRQNEVNNLQNEISNLRQRQEQSEFDAMVRRQSEFINNSRVNTSHAAAAAAPSPTDGPSAEEIADAIVQKQNNAKKKTEIISMAKEALSACQAQSTWLKQNKTAAIPKASFADARACLNYAVAAAPAARDEREPDLARQLDDAAYELRILILSLDK